MKIFYALAIIAMTACRSNAATVEIDFYHDSSGVPSYELTSITAYVDGEPSCNAIIDGDEDGTLFCDHEISAGEHLFTLAGQMRNGRQTKMSKPVPFNVIAPKAPVIRSLRIVAEIDGEEIILVYP